MSDALHVKYRPTDLDSVIGQDAVVKALKGHIDRKDSQAFLLMGPSGCGKTTLARIVATELGCKLPDGIIEIDAATNTGVDNMRAVQESLRYKPFGGQRRAIVVDEAHGLSRQAWDSLLKAVEEPPSFLLWFFCTTNPDKVPRTIKTRCSSYTLSELGRQDLMELVDEVCQEEGIELVKGVMDLVVKEAGGSARQALVNLAAVRDAENRKEAAELLKSVVEESDAIELCRLLIGGGSWRKVVRTLKNLEGQNPEGVRIIVCNYMAKAALGTDNEERAMGLLHILDQFSQPYNPSEKMAPLIISVGRAMYGE